MTAASGGLLSNIVSLIAHRASAEVSESLITEVSRVVSTITAEYLCFKPKDVENAVDSQRSRFHKPASVIYIPVFECPVVSMGIFYMRFPHSFIPLHDHPGINGVIKTIHGCMKITQVNAAPDQECKDGFLRVSDLNAVISDHANAEVVVVQPQKYNFHEIISYNVQGREPSGAAFFDVLFPPYDPPSRDCSYYQILPVQRSNERELFLRRFPGPPPDDVFATEVGPYCGPTCSF